MSQHCVEKSLTVSDFYSGKTIFLTGATGFVGSLILESLLRCFPGIAKIYILVREKRGVPADARKDLIFKKKVFHNLLRDKPNVKDKVHVICGDITQPNLGMSDNDMMAVINQATIVFHCGAIIKFINSAKSLAVQNSRSTDHVVTLCKKLRHLEVLVYTSTAYSFSNYAPHKIKEMVYRLPYPAQTFLDELEYGTEKSFNDLAARCKPDWLNSYTFSKALSENILQDKASDLPVAIIRPAVVFCTWRNPVPGYIDNRSGITKLLTAYSRGFLRVFFCSPDATVDLVPADVVVHAHLAAAWLVATKRCRCPSPFVVNLSSFKKYPISLVSITDEVLKLVRKNCAPNGFVMPKKAKLYEGPLFWMHITYENHVPAVVYDSYLWLKGKKFRLSNLNKYLKEHNETLYKFITTDFEYDYENFLRLSEELNPEERKMLYMDLDNLDFHSYMDSLAISSDMYDWSMDKLSVKERKQQIYKKTIVYTSIQISFVLVLCLIIFYIVWKFLL